MGSFPRDADMQNKSTVSPLPPSQDPARAPHPQSLARSRWLDYGEGGMVRDYASTRKRDAMKEKHWEGVEVRQMDILVEGRARWKSRREGIRTRTGEGLRHGI